MPSSPDSQSTLDLQARWDKIRVANVYDALSSLGSIHQCLDLRLRPLFPRRHLAGRAMTVRGCREPHSRAEMQAQGFWVDDAFAKWGRA